MENSVPYENLLKKPWGWNAIYEMYNSKYTITTGKKKK